MWLWSARNVDSSVKNWIFHLISLKLPHELVATLLDSTDQNPSQHKSYFGNKLKASEDGSVAPQGGLHITPSVSLTQRWPFKNHWPASSLSVSLPPFSLICLSFLLSSLPLCLSFLSLCLLFLFPALLTLSAIFLQAEIKASCFLS